MAIARAERRVNLGAFVFAALLLDAVLWLFVLLGWEAVTIPADFTTTHQPQFVFPYSHGLLAGVAWSLLAGMAAHVCCPRLAQARARAAALVAAAVFSHWLLDAIVHAPEMPVMGNDSAKVGLALWHAMPVALALEAAIALAGLYAFLSGSTLSRSRKLWLSALSLFVLVFTVVGMTVAPAPPSDTAMAMSSLATIVVVCALIGWLVRGSKTKANRP
jgi:hypothetical protein